MSKVLNENGITTTFTISETEDISASGTHDCFDGEGGYPYISGEGDLVGTPFLDSQERTIPVADLKDYATTLFKSINVDSTTATINHIGR